MGQMEHAGNSAERRARFEKPRSVGSILKPWVHLMVRDRSDRSQLLGLFGPLANSQERSVDYRDRHQAWAACVPRPVRYPHNVPATDVESRGAPLAADTSKVS